MQGGAGECNQIPRIRQDELFAHHLRSVTPDFLEAEDDVKDKVQVTRGSRKDDQSERQERLWASRMMSVAQVDLSHENLTLDEADRCVFVRDLECVNMH